ncbi:DUF1697 domain-containing protein [bacterium]|nr:DUF1697 domain-containing protein [bacterium]MCI0607155.1 DUF1697 domain-containing protein [bacterium]
MKYVAFPRGINVGGKNMVKMDELKKAFESLGAKNVKTLLASGNVLFESTEKDPLKLRKVIEDKMNQKFGLKVNVILRTIGEIQDLVDSNPFQKIKITPETRLYVTFLSEKSKSSLKIPYESPERDFKIVRASHKEVCSVLTLTPARRSVDVMAILEKEFGRNVTTRNWNTVLKLLKA